jgi:hypothetical protein
VTPNLSVDDVLTATRSVRKRPDFTGLGDIYRKNFNARRPPPKPSRAEGDSLAEHHDTAVSSAEYLAVHIGKAPWSL